MKFERLGTVEPEPEPVLEWWLEKSCDGVIRLHCRLKPDGLAYRVCEVSLKRGLYRASSIGSETELPRDILGRIALDP